MNCQRILLLLFMVFSTSNAYTSTPPDMSLEEYIVGANKAGLFMPNTKTKVQKNGKTCGRIYKGLLTEYYHGENVNNEVELFVYGEPIAEYSKSFIFAYQYDPSLYDKNNANQIQQAIIDRYIDCNGYEPALVLFRIRYTEADKVHVMNFIQLPNTIFRKDQMVPIVDLLKYSAEVVKKKAN